MNQIKNEIVLIGGTGYVGSVVSEYFNFKDKAVTVIDNNIYQKNITTNSKNQYLNYDIRDHKKILNLDFSDKNIVFLAGLVGDPITKKYPNESKDINEVSIIKFINGITNYKKLIFISTCSNYGLSKSQHPLTEDDPLNPISLYSKSKVAVENFLIDSKKDYTILRFATAFGHSNNMRFDLTLNEFTALQYFNKHIEVYDYETSRPYCHVMDFANIIEKVISSKQELVNKQIFNVGSNQNNISKKNLIKIISEKTGASNFTLVENSKDKRNYIVDFSKVSNILGFSPRFTIEDGIQEIIANLKNDKYGLAVNFELLTNYFGNYEIPPTPLRDV
jgi:nucleoside-diphosphate-sugar epimerase